MALKDEVARFLKSNGHIQRIHFTLLRYKVSPTVYQKELAEAIATEAIEVRTQGSGTAAAAATYNPERKSLELHPSFNLLNLWHQAVLVHEATHACLDIQMIGAHPGHENEAVAYLAEAIFLGSAGVAPLPADPIRTVSHRIAKSVLSGNPWVTDRDAAQLAWEVAKNPHYARKFVYSSTGLRKPA